MHACARRLDGVAAPTCAVVSSAGALLGSGLGAEIDAHDFVVRFNDAPTDGFEGDVGSRTHLRVVNSQVGPVLYLKLAEETSQELGVACHLHMCCCLVIQVIFVKANQSRSTLTQLCRFGFVELGNLEVG